MTLEEFKSALMEYVNAKSEDPEEADIRILEIISDYSEPEAVSEEDIQARIDAAVGENDKMWIKKYKDRFYSAEDPEEVTEPVTVENEPEQEEFKSVLDYEW